MEPQKYELFDATYNLFKKKKFLSIAQTILTGN